MLKKILYLIGLILILSLLFWGFKKTNLNSFIDIVESRTFDLRQTVMINANAKKVNDDIVIVAIDDASYEYILDNYGEWPLTRDIYAQMIEYLEQQQPKIIAFDLMFVKSLKSKPNADKALVEAMKKYPNVYTAMNFDNQPEELRKPVKLPDTLAIQVENHSDDINFDDITFSNCRAILSDILNSTSNVGIINVSRADDGILRKMPMFARYQNKFYPHLGLKVGLDYLKTVEGQDIKSYVVDKNSNLILGNRKVYLDKDGSAILNWYGPSGTYTHIPMYKLIKKIKGEPTDLNYSFKNKIIYFGTTAASLFDIKTVPAGKIYPGVEVQATYVNNLIDNNFITKAGKHVTVIVSIILALITALLVMQISSAIIASTSTVAIYMAYVIFSYYAMKLSNIWIELIYPLLAVILAFITSLIVKYLIKSRDFEQQYKLATTDGLTDLYNHRYFQDQMKMNVEHSKRYETNFSLIIIDIDFFKKFNDTYGHQSGDAVLRQVAQILKRNVRATDVVCRYGGEEMSIILPNAGKDEAITTAEKICTIVSQKIFKLNNDKETHVTISLGVSTYPFDGETPSELIEAADKRLYNAKNNGRNQVGKN